MSLLNRSAVRDYAMAVIQSDRPALVGKITRVSGEFFDAIEGSVRQAVINRVRAAPSKGKTLK